VLYDPALDELVEESRNVNQLIAAFTEVMGSWEGAEALEQIRNTPSLPGQEPLADTEVIEIPGPVGPIPARIRRPSSTDPRGAYLDIHGGGWCIGSAEATDQHDAELADATGVATVSIDYRLAPEDPFPAGPDDCEAAALWLIDHAADLFDTSTLLIGGGSAGAHLAALTLLRLRDRHDAATAYRGANLVVGAFDLGMTPSQRFADDAMAIPTRILEECFAYAMPGLDREARRDPQHSPLYAPLHDLPPALFTTGTLCPLLDDSLFMAARWEAAGNRSELAVYPESSHVFAALPTQMGIRARERMHRFIEGCLEPAG
jgi:acetyl esterase